MDEYMSEKEQLEWLRSRARQNGPWILAGIALGALGLFGWRLWQDHVDQVAREASARYEQLVQAVEQGDRTGTLAALGELERDHPSSPYVDQGRLAAARIYVSDGELDKAATELQAVMQHSSDPGLALLARLRLARVQIAQQKPDAAIATLQGAQFGAFAAGYHEVLGDAYYAKGDSAGALREYRAARAADTSGMADVALLDLKISDLAATPGADAVARNDKPAAAK